MGLRAKCKDIGIDRVGDDYLSPLSLCRLATNIRTKEGLEKDSIGTLANLIDMQGQLSAVEAIWDDEKNEFIIHAGQRRYLAILQLCDEGRGPGKIRINVVNSKFVEGVHRIYRQFAYDTGNVIPSEYEQAGALKEAYEKYGQSISDIAKNIGRSDQHVRNLLKLLEVPEELREKMRPSTAMAFARSDEKTQKVVREKIERGEKIKGRDIRPSVGDEEELNPIKYVESPSVMSFEEISQQIKIADRYKMASKTPKERAAWHHRIIGLRTAARLEVPLK